jgi:hypothetical protein
VRVVGSGACGAVEVNAAVCGLLKGVLGGLRVKVRQWQRTVMRTGWMRMWALLGR